MAPCHLQPRAGVPSQSVSCVPVSCLPLHPEAGSCLDLSAQRASGPVSLGARGRRGQGWFIALWCLMDASFQLTVMYFLLWADGPTRRLFCSLLGCRFPLAAASLPLPRSLRFLASSHHSVSFPSLARPPAQRSPPAFPFSMSLLFSSLSLLLARSPRSPPIYLETPPARCPRARKVARAGW